MNEQIMNILTPVLVTLATSVVTVCVGLVTKPLVEWMKKKEMLDSRTLQGKITKDVVQYVQQTYYDLNGADKLKNAQSRLVIELAKSGIQISQNQMNVLIESAVKSMKDATNEVLTAGKTAQIGTAIDIEKLGESLDSLK